jgi:hypothetical protein
VTREKDQAFICLEDRKSEVVRLARDGQSQRMRSCPAFFGEAGFWRYQWNAPEVLIAPKGAGAKAGERRIVDGRLTGQSLPIPMGWRGEPLDPTHDHFAQ